jgi:hypothetical protein
MMTKHPVSQPSHLFTMRVWLEELGEGRSEWRGQVLSVSDGETRYFRDWPALIAHLTEMLESSASELE